MVVGALGRLHEQKGFDVLIRAVAGLPGISLVIVGDGPERQALERLAVDLGVADRVSMPGWTDDATSRLRSFDVLALPSRYEGLPLVLLEAMLGGVPVVASAVGGVPDAVRDDESGLLVPPDDVDALQGALSRMAADPSLRRRLANAAEVEARQRFTVATMARSYESLYDELSATGRGHRTVPRH
jgi:glycosyltransferase involved in cell wall biosynthesis